MFTSTVYMGNTNIGHFVEVTCAVSKIAPKAPRGYLLEKSNTQNNLCQVKTSVILSATDCRVK